MNPGSFVSNISDFSQWWASGSNLCWCMKYSSDTSAQIAAELHTSAWRDATNYVFPCDQEYSNSSAVEKIRRHLGIRKQFNWQTRVGWFGGIVGDSLERTLINLMHFLFFYRCSEVLFLR
jgi:hypothetical protein